MVIMTVMTLMILLTMKKRVMKNQMKHHIQVESKATEEDYFQRTVILIPKKVILVSHYRMIQLMKVV